MNLSYNLRCGKRFNLRYREEEYTVKNMVCIPILRTRIVIHLQERLFAEPVERHLVEKVG